VVSGESLSDTTHHTPLTGLLSRGLAGLKVLRRPAALRIFGRSAARGRSAVVGSAARGWAVAVAALAAWLAVVPRFAVFARLPGLARRHGRFAALLAQKRLPRQLDPVVLVDGDHLHVQHVADPTHVLDPADVLVVQLADVAQTVASGQDFDEGAEIFDR
jgi:hypothetical protein